MGRHEMPRRSSLDFLATASGKKHDKLLGLRRDLTRDSARLGVTELTLSLYRACSTCNVDGVRADIDAGARVNEASSGPEKAGQTALYRATIYGILGKDDQVLMALLGRGADWKLAAVPRDISIRLLEHAQELEANRSQAAGDNRVTKLHDCSLGTKAKPVHRMMEAALAAAHIPILKRKNSAGAA